VEPAPTTGRVDVHCRSVEGVQFGVQIESNSAQLSASRTALSAESSRNDLDRRGWGPGGRRFKSCLPDLNPRCERASTSSHRERPFTCKSVTKQRRKANRDASPRTRFFGLGIPAPYRRRPSAVSSSASAAGLRHLPAWQGAFGEPTVGHRIGQCPTTPPRQFGTDGSAGLGARPSNVARSRRSTDSRVSPRV
jgi:hypothetical protein